MPYHGSARCHGCSGEDCVCCEVYLEERASQRYEEMYGPEDRDDFEEEEYDAYDEDEDEVDESMDGDFDSAMRDAGFGTDEDYGDYGGDGDY